MRQKHINKSSTNVNPGGKNGIHSVNRNIFDMVGEVLEKIALYMYIYIYETGNVCNVSFIHILSISAAFM